MESDRRTWLVYLLTLINVFAVSINSEVNLVVRPSARINVPNYVTVKGRYVDRNKAVKYYKYLVQVQSVEVEV